MNQRMRLAFFAFAICLLSLFKINVAFAAEILAYPFTTNQDSIITNDFAGHASYCTGCQGVDYDVSHGTALYASMSGTVTVIDGYGDQGDAQNCVKPTSYGNYVKITNGSWEIIYGHMANGQMEVADGDSVTEGQLLGYSSNSGYTCGSDVNGSNYHLHFEVEYDNVDKDPYAEGYFIIDSDGSYHYPSEADDSTTTSTTSTLITTALTTSFSEYNSNNTRWHSVSGVKESPEICLTTVTEGGDLHWWGDPSASALANPGIFERSGSYEYTTLYIEDYTGSCTGAIVYDDWGGATRAYVVQAEQWEGWLTREGPKGSGTTDPIYCGNPITNVYGKGHISSQCRAVAKVTYPHS